MPQRPRPASIKEARGNPGRRPIVAETTPADDARAAAPEWLDEPARAIWTRLAPELTRLRLLGRPDELAFGRYCETFARWLALIEHVREVGEVYEITTDSGTVRRPNPEVIIADRLENRLVALEDRFGLNPSERQRIYVQRAAANLTPGDLFGTRKAADAPSPKSGEAKPAAKALPGPIGALH